jgi:polysaccharide pyruvyl transferase WcaK-like protein
MKKVILVSDYGHRNLGDDAQGLAVAVRLRKALPDAEISVSIGWTKDRDEIPGCSRNHLFLLAKGLICPEQSKLSRKIYLASGIFGYLCRNLARALRVSWRLTQGWLSAKTGLLCTLNKRFRQVLRIVRSGDLLYISGGGFFADTWMWHGLVVRMVLVRLFHYFRKPVVVSGQGIGPLKNWYGRHFLKKSLRHVDMLTLRNPEQSERLVREIGVRGPTILSVGDDSYGLDPAPREEAEELIRSAGLSPSEPIIGVEVRFTTYHGAMHDALEHCAPAAKILDRLVERFGAKVLFFTSVFASAQRWDDRDVAYRVLRHMRHWASAAVIHQEYDAASCKALLGCCRMFLGTTYHPCLFALTAGVPAVALYEGVYYRDKMQGAFDFYGLGHCAMEYAQATPEAVEQVFAALLADPEEFRRKTAKATAEISRSIDVTITRTVELLE